MIEPTWLQKLLLYQLLIYSWAVGPLLSNRLDRLCRLETCKTHARCLSSPRLYLAASTPSNIWAPVSSYIIPFFVKVRFLFIQPALLCPYFLIKISRLPAFSLVVYDLLPSLPLPFYRGWPVSLDDPILSAFPLRLSAADGGNITCVD
jgi:hypothetical protein